MVEIASKVDSLIDFVTERPIIEGHIKPLVTGNIFFVIVILL